MDDESYSGSSCDSTLSWIDLDDSQECALEELREGVECPACGTFVSLSTTREMETSPRFSPILSPPTSSSEKKWVPTEPPTCKAISNLGALRPLERSEGFSFLAPMSKGGSERKRKRSSTVRKTGNGKKAVSRPPKDVDRI